MIWNGGLQMFNFFFNMTCSIKFNKIIKIKQGFMKFIFLKVVSKIPVKCTINQLSKKLRNGKINRKIKNFLKF